MPNRVKVIVDSSAGVSPRLAENWEIEIVPLSVNWNGMAFRDCIDPLPEDFYRELKRRSSNIVTAAPSPNDFHAVCDKALTDKFEKILIVTLSAHMSSTFNNARLAAEKFTDGHVVVLDSGQGAGALALSAAHAARVAKEGADLEQVMQAAKKASKSAELYMVLNSLVSLQRSGRLSATQAGLGSLLRVKPILTIENGQLKVVDRIRTMRRAASRLLELLKSNPKPRHMMVMFADTQAAAEGLTQQVIQRFPEVRVDLSPVSAVIAAHAGPGLLGIASLHI
jgi:DegV family protein with EDD domain